MDLFTRFESYPRKLSDQEAYSDICQLLKKQPNTFRTWLRILSVLMDCEFQTPLTIDQRLPADIECVVKYFNAPVDCNVIESLGSLSADDREILAHQIAIILLDSVRAGLKWIRNHIPGKPSELEIYTRAIAWLMKIARGSFKKESVPLPYNLNREDCAGDTPDDFDISLTEILIKATCIISVFAKEHVTMFESVEEIPFCLINVAPAPLGLYIIGTFPTLAFDPKNLFPISLRISIVEAVALSFDAYVKRLLYFTRSDVVASVAVNAEEQVGEAVRDSASSSSKSAETLQNDTHTATLNDSLDGEGVSTSAYHSAVPVPTQNPVVESALPSDGASASDSANSSGVNSTHVSSSNLLEINENVLATLNSVSISVMTNLLKFALDYATYGSTLCIKKRQGICPKLSNWLTNVTSSSFFTTLVGKILSLGGLRCFHYITRISQIASKDVFVSWVILRYTYDIHEALHMVRLAGLHVMLLDPLNARRLISFLLEGLSTEQKGKYVETWLHLFKEVPQCTNNSAFTSVITNEVLLDCCNVLIDKLRPYALYKQKQQEMQSLQKRIRTQELSGIHKNGVALADVNIGDDIDVMLVRELLLHMVQLVPSLRNTERFEAYMGVAQEFQQRGSNVKILAQELVRHELCLFMVWAMELSDDIRFSKYVQDLKNLLNSDISIDKRHLAFTLTLLDYNPKESPNLRLYAQLFFYELDLRSMFMKSNTAEWYTTYSKMVEIAGQLDQFKDASGFSVVLGKTIRDYGLLFARIVSKILNAGLPGNQEAATLYVTCMNIYFMLKDNGQRVCVQGDIFANAMATACYYTIADYPLMTLANGMLEYCPLDTLMLVGANPTRFRFCIMKRAKEELLNLDLQQVTMKLLLVVANELIAENHWMDLDFMCFFLVVEALIAALGDVELMRLLLATKANLRLLHKIVVVANTIHEDTRLPLLRVQLNITLLRTYLCIHDYAVEEIDKMLLGTSVDFVTNELDRLLNLKGGSFIIRLRGISTKNPLAKGYLTTIDVIANASFRQLFCSNVDYDKKYPVITQHEADSNAGVADIVKSHGVFTWGLLTPEFSEALACITLLYKAFSQLPNTKLIFITRHYLSIVAHVLGDNVMNIKRKFLTDDNLVRHDAAALVYEYNRKLKANTLYQRSVTL